MSRRPRPHSAAGCGIGAALSLHPVGGSLALEGPASWPPRTPCCHDGRTAASREARGLDPHDAAGRLLSGLHRAGGPGAACGGLDVTSGREAAPLLRSGSEGWAGRWRKSLHFSVVEVSARVRGSMATRQVNPQDFRWTHGALGFSVTTRTRAPCQLFLAQPHVPSGSLTKS